MAYSDNLLSSLNGRGFTAKRNGRYIYLQLLGVSGEDCFAIPNGLPENKKISLEGTEGVTPEGVVNVISGFSGSPLRPNCQPKTLELQASFVADKGLVSLT